MTVVRIPKNRLKMGMYVESVECPQFQFDKRRFLLDLESDLEAILATPAEYVTVNTARGRAFPEGPSSARPAVGVSEAARARAADMLARSAVDVRLGFAGLVSGDESARYQSFTPVVRDMLDTMAEGPAIVLELTRLKTKDEGTFVHSLAVGALMSAMGMSLDFDAETVELMGVAGILHDFGKLLIPNLILNKKGTLTVAERQIVRNHPELGYQRLAAYPDMPDMVLQVCRCHHELLDGTGYPRGLQAAEIDIFVRIATICDVFDALTSLRPYKKPWTTMAAITWMYDQEQRFDRKLLLRLGDVAEGLARDR